ncbi:MAG: DUF5696 domain-containing protein [Bryobacteraceae bacterium]
MMRVFLFAFVLCGTLAAQTGFVRVPRPQGEDLVLANQHLRVTVRPDNLTLAVEDLAARETWGPDPWENAAGRIHLRGRRGETLAVSLGGAAGKKVEETPGGIRLSLSGFRSRLGPVREDRSVEKHLSLSLAVILAKDRPELTFRIEQLQNSSRYWQVETIEWPLRLFPVRTVEDDGYIVFPQEQGFIVPSRFDKVGYFRYLNWVWERIAGQATVFDSSSMPWFGARKGRSSFLCIIERADDVAYGLIANDVRAPGQEPAPPSAVPGPGTSLFAPRLSAIWPCWRSVKGELGYPRVARYVFQPGGGYVEMCKTYRKYAREQGTLVTLKQKIAANLDVERLIGAANFEIQVVANRPRDPRYLSLAGPVFDGYHHVQTTFEQVRQIVEDLKHKLGVDRAVIRIAGWGKKGYDNYRPIDQASEVNAEAGGPAQLVRAIEAAKAAGYLAQLWDNYRNLDLESPGYDEKYIMRDAFGALVPGFTSEGGHSQEICPMEGAKLFRRNMDKYLRELRPNAIFLDTVSSLPLVECYDSRHPLTRALTREQRMNIMRVATNAKVVLGAEGPPQDWNLSLVSFYDEHPIRLGIEVPLYGLVYHECAMLYRQHGSPYNYGMDNYGYPRGPWPAKFLRGLLYGDQSSWTVSNRAYWAWRKTFKSINDVLAPHQRRLAHEELLKHEMLTPDFLVQRTVFSPGVEVTVNYGEFAFKLEDGTELPAYGYRIKDSTGGKSGRVSIELVSGDR